MSSSHYSFNGIKSSLIERTSELLKEAYKGCHLYYYYCVIVTIIATSIIIDCVFVHLIQVIGLTASVGVGKARSMKQAVDHVLTLCANLDCQDISTVTENIAELNRHVNKPNEGDLLINCISFDQLCQNHVGRPSEYWQWSRPLLGKKW